jgi:prepilin peptidase CpaA
MSIDTPHFIVALTALLGCAHDLHNRRIPNYVTFGSALLALGYGAVTGGWSGLGLSASGWALGIALFVPFFLLRGMGAGDVKLLAALGAWVGPMSLLSLTFYTAIAGGVMALLVVLWQRKLVTTFRNVWLLVCHFRVAGLQPMSELSLENKNAPRLAYGLPIAVGAMLTIWLH